MTRQSKTPRQRAEEALGVAERRVQKCEKRVTDTKAALAQANTDLTAARRRRDYAKQDPALPQDERGKREPEAFEVPRQPGPGDQA